MGGPDHPQGSAVPGACQGAGVAVGKHPPVDRQQRGAVGAEPAVAVDVVGGQADGLGHRVGRGQAPGHAPCQVHRRRPGGHDAGRGGLRRRAGDRGEGHAHGPGHAQRRGAPHRQRADGVAELVDRAGIHELQPAGEQTLVDHAHAAVPPLDRRGNPSHRESTASPAATAAEPAGHISKVARNTVGA